MSAVVNGLVPECKFDTNLFCVLEPSSFVDLIEIS